MLDGSRWGNGVATNRALGVVGGTVVGFLIASKSHFDCYLPHVFALLTSATLDEESCFLGHSWVSESSWVKAQWRKIS